MKVVRSVLIRLLGLAVLQWQVAVYGQGVGNQQVISYVATTGQVSLSAATTAATVQQPTGSLPVQFPSVGSPGAAIYCSVACTASIIVGATAPTTTLGTIHNSNQEEPAATVKFYTASNYSGGTTLVIYNIGAGGTLAIDLSLIHLSGTTTSNITIAISSITGTANITFFPQELH